MEKLTGHGRPHSHFAGEVGQHYEDLDTGDIYECRISSQYSPTHGWPVGGYVWERRAKGEDIQELFGSGSGGSVSWNDVTDKPFGEAPLSVTTSFSWDSVRYSYSSAVAAIPPYTTEGETVKVKWDGIEYETTVNSYVDGDRNLFWYIGHVGFYNYRVGYTNAPIPFMWQWGGDFNECKLYCADADTHTIELPVTTVSKIDSKFLPENGAFIVNVSMTNTSFADDVTSGSSTDVDRTYDEIRTALDAGQNVIMRVSEGGLTYQLVPSGIDTWIIYFASVTGTHIAGKLSSDPYIIVVMMATDGVVHYKKRLLS